jgi:hypothetical protein
MYSFFLFIIQTKSATLSKSAGSGVHPCHIPYPADDQILGGQLDLSFLYRIVLVGHILAEE